jgi:hypothetical protein
MGNDGRSLDEHRKAFESAFFPIREEALQDERDTEAVVDPINDLLAGGALPNPEALLARLDELGLERDVLVVLSLFPLVAVAWADGRVDLRERGIVLDAADRAGLSRGGVHFRLLESWLSEPPNEGLFELWKQYARAVATAIGPDWKSQLTDQILSLCARVAEATGEFLALDKISSAEYAVLRELRAAFD